MKKLLLFSLLAAGALSASAAGYKDYFHATYNGQEIGQGATVVLTHYHDAPYHDYTNDKDIPAVTFEDAIAMVNNTEEAQYAIGGMYYVDPSVDAFTAAYPFSYPQFCDVSNCFPPNMGEADNCGFTGGSEIATDGSFVWNLHLCYAPEAFTSGTFEIRLQAGEKVYDPNGMYYDEEEENYYNIEPIDGTNYSFFVKFAKENTAVGAIEAETDAAPVYYNLQGVRVAEPETGLYIVKRGDKVSKEIVRK